MPGFHAILLVREEGDIIAQTLAHLLSWCDTLFVFDTGSTDNTRDLITDAAAKDRRIRIMSQGPVIYSNALRPWIFERVRAQFRKGDWIARVDSDEFYHIPPPAFIRERLAPCEGRLCALLYDFLLSRPEVKGWQDGAETIADRARPIEDRRRWFRRDDYAELRLFRYRRSMRWPDHRHDPWNPGLLARERIPIRHYRARDPLQVQVRCAIREPCAEALASAGWHWKLADWRHFVFADDDPAMIHWPPGEPLPVWRTAEHLSPPWRRAAEHIAYRSGLIALRDRLRPRFSPDYAPAPMTPELQRQIADNLAQIRERPFLRDLPPQVRAKRERLIAAPVPEDRRGA